MKKFFRAALGALAALALLAGLLSAVILVAGTDADYMHALFVRHSDPSLSGMDAREYPAMAERITGYLAGKQENLQTTLMIHGRQREAFSEKELLHMQDVRLLFALCRGLFIGWLAFLLLAALLLARFPRMRAAAARSYLFTGLAVAAAGAGLAAWAAIDFHTLFTLFHHVFFTNDLWQLNPNTDLLLQLMPTGFFVDYAARIGLIWLAGAAALALGAFLYLKRRKKKHDV